MAVVGTEQLSRFRVPEPNGLIEAGRKYAIAVRQESYFKDLSDVAVQREEGTPGFCIPQPDESRR